MKTTLELVHDLQRLLSGPERWTQHANARDEAMTVVGASSSRACCWCIHGALDVIPRTSEESNRLRTLARRAAGLTAVAETVSLIYWNDATHRTFADIQALMVKMEELAKDQP